MAALADAPPPLSLDDMPDEALRRIVLFVGGFPAVRTAVSKARGGALDIAAVARDLCALAQTAKRFRLAVDELANLFGAVFVFHWGHRLADGTENGEDATEPVITHDAEAFMLNDLLDEGLTTFKRACSQRMRLLRHLASAAPLPALAPLAPLSLPRDAAPATTLEDYAYVLDVFDPQDEQVHCAYCVYGMATDDSDGDAANEDEDEPCPSPYWPRVRTRFSAPGALRVAVTALRVTDGAMALLFRGETTGDGGWRAVRCAGTLPFPWPCEDGVGGADTVSDLRLELQWEQDDGSEYDRLLQAQLHMPRSRWRAAAGDAGPSAPITGAELLLALEHLEWV